LYKYIDSRSIDGCFLPDVKEKTLLFLVLIQVQIEILIFVQFELVSMTMEEYDKRFFELLKYVDFIIYDKVKIQRFLSGLPSLYIDKIQYRNPKTLEEAIRRVSHIYAIKGWTTPRNITEVGSFMGLVGYYQIFIKGFSNISSPITSLQKKGVKFEWTSKCEESFH
jgi:hypothetical protein